MDARFLLIALTVLAVPQIIADLTLTEREATFVSGLLGLVQLYIELWITYRTLDRSGAAPDGYHRLDATEGRFGAAFAASLLTVLGTLVGLALLVVPGVLVFLLWRLSLPVIAAQRASSIEAMRTSWRIGRPHLWLLSRLSLVVVAAVAIVVAISLTLSGAAFAVWLNPAITAVLMFAAILWTQTYLALVPTP